MGWLLNSIAALFSSIQRAVAKVERLFEILDELKLPSDVPDAVSSRTVQGEVSFTDMSFSYKPNGPMLGRVSSRIRTGEMTAFMGKIGADKTTLVNLLIRAYESTAGEIRPDSVSLGRYSREGLSRCFSVVLQETVLLHGVVPDNPRYVHPETTKAGAVHTAELAHTHGSIQRLPQGYQALTSGTVGRSSQGQYQLLTITQTLMSQASILIPDEAISSVDTTTGQRLQQVTLHLLEGHTCFLITHHPSIIRRTDRIFVVGEQGIVESSTYDELMRKRGVYWNVLQ